MVLGIRQLQELARKKRIPLKAFFINLSKTYDSMDLTSLWRVLAYFGVPQTMIPAIRQFHYGLQAGVRLEDSESLRWILLEQGCVKGTRSRSPYFVVAAVIRLIHTHFDAEKSIMSTKVAPRKISGMGGNNGRIASAGNVVTLKHAIN